MLNGPQTRGITAEQRARGILKDLAFVELLSTLCSRQLHTASRRISADVAILCHPATVSRCCDTATSSTVSRCCDTATSCNCQQMLRYCDIMQLSADVAILGHHATVSRCCDTGTSCNCQQILRYCNILPLSADVAVLRLPATVSRCCDTATSCNCQQMLRYFDVLQL